MALVVFLRGAHREAVIWSVRTLILHGILQIIDTGVTLRESRLTSAQQLLGNQHILLWRLRIE